MEFALTEEQQMLQKSVTGYLEDASPLGAVRKFADGEAEVAESIDQGLRDMGVVGLTIPESHGGLGLGILEAALVQECLGGAVCPAPLPANIMAATGIELAGDGEQKSKYLPKMAASEITFGVAISESVGACGDAGVTDNGGRLGGTALFALEANTATHLLVSTKSGGFYIVERDAPGLRTEEMLTIDKTRIFNELAFDGVAAEPLATGEMASETIGRMIATGRILLAGDTLGAAQHMLDAAVAYSKEREQFGRVIGSFQAVKHMCAEMAAKLEPARALVWHAAYALGEGDDEGHLMACLAKSHLSEVGTFIARTATEVHGGMGFTDLLGLHYWFKRIGANRQLLGGPERVREDAARLQGFA